jgi:hypothetical protein
LGRQRLSAIAVAKRTLARIWEWQPLRRSLGLYLVLRVGLSLWAALVVAMVPAETGPNELIRPYFGSEPVDTGLARWLLGPWQRFDTMRYLHLAVHGYEPGTSQTVFPPLYPFLIRVVGRLLGERYLLAALLISNLCALGYLTVFFMLAEQAVGRKAARRAQVYAAIFPWSFVLLAGYTEPVFLLFATLAFWSARRGRTWAAGLCGGLAALTRLQGGILALPLLIEILQQRRWKLWPPRVDLLWVLIPPLASVGFLLGRMWAGIEPIHVTYATYWHHVSAPPWVGIATNIRNMIAGMAQPVDYLDFAAAGFAIALTVAAWRRLRLSYAVYMTLAVVFNTSHMRMPNPMVSVGRHSVELFPGFFLLGRLEESNPKFAKALSIILLVLLFCLSGLFVLWGWVG